MAIRRALNAGRAAHAQLTLVAPWRIGNYDRIFSHCASANKHAAAPTAQINAAKREKPWVSSGPKAKISMLATAHATDTQNCGVKSRLGGSLIKRKLISKPPQSGRLRQTQSRSKTKGKSVV